MKTKQIIEEMEKEFDEKFPGDVVTMEEDGTHARITSSLYNRDSIKDFINKSIRTLLESFGEEIIALFSLPKTDDKELEQALKDMPGVEQVIRLKVKEIISSIGK